MHTYKSMTKIFQKVADKLNEMPLVKLPTYEEVCRWDKDQVECALAWVNMHCAGSEFGMYAQFLPLDMRFTPEGEKVIEFLTTIVNLMDEKGMSFDDAMMEALRENAAT